MMTYSNHNYVFFGIDLYLYMNFVLIIYYIWGGGGAVAQSLEGLTPGKEVVGSTPRSPLVGSVSVLCDRQRQK